ncbi:hypothetical protein DRN74_05995 [Candidatus Micrarchaeota archaeon]|nr:MAG: hypothetical protein DRN74_05995 [Candidatus Micrarchaeota archaeon]
MGDISNKTLVSLLIVAIAISLIGTWVSVSKLGNLRITGLQTSNQTTQQGTAQIQVLSAAIIALRINTVNFGSGQINGSAPGTQYCHLRSDGSLTVAGNTFSGDDYYKSTYCDGFTETDANVNYDNETFVLENAGNVDISNVTMTSSNGETGFKGSSYFDDANAGYKFKIIDEGSACDQGATNYESTFNSFSTTALPVCYNFTYADANDAFAVQINITLSEESKPASFTDTITFTANV